MYTFDWLVTPVVRSGTTPLWHPGERVLYWSDPGAGALYRYNPSDGTNECCLSDRPVGAMALQEDGSILFFRDQANIVSFRDGAVQGTVVQSLPDFRLGRFASAAAAPDGSVFCSVLSDARHTGRLLHLDRSGQLTLVEDGFGIPGALAFDAAGRSLFFCDAHSTHLAIWRYEYAPDSAELTNRTLFYTGIDDDGAPGAPMGLAADASGGLWVSRWGGSALVHHSPDGEIDQTVPFAVRTPAGLAFGGEGLADLYVTTGGGHLRQFNGLHAGDIAKMTGEGLAGQPLRTSAISMTSE